MALVHFSSLFWSFLEILSWFAGYICCFPHEYVFGYENTRCKWLCLASFKVPGPEAVLWAISSSLSLESSSEGMCSDRVRLEVQLTVGEVSDYRSRYWGGFVIHICIFCKGMTGSVQDTIMWSHTDMHKLQNYSYKLWLVPWCSIVHSTIQYSCTCVYAMTWVLYCIILYIYIYIYNTVS